MKVVLVYALLIMVLCCCNRATALPDADSTNPEKSDRIEMKVEILNILPIGWGVKYRCKILSAPSEIFSEIDSVFVFSISVGNDDFSPSLGEATLTFERTDRISEESYLPGGTTGTMNNKREIWDLVHFTSKELDVNLSEKNQFSVLVAIKTELPIAWGFSYTCELLSLDDGASSLDSSFSFYATEIADDLPLIRIGKARITFRKIDFESELRTAEKSTRMIDKDGVHWYITKYEPL